MQQSSKHEPELSLALINAELAYDKSGRPGGWFRPDYPAVEGPPVLVEVSEPSAVAVATADAYVKVHELDSANPQFYLLVDAEVYVIYKEPEGWRAYGSEGLIEHLLG